MDDEDDEADRFIDFMLDMSEDDDDAVTMGFMRPRSLRARSVGITAPTRSSAASRSSLRNSSTTTTMGPTRRMFAGLEDDDDDDSDEEDTDGDSKMPAAAPFSLSSSTSTNTTKKPAASKPSASSTMNDSRRRMAWDALDKPNAPYLWRDLPVRFQRDKEFILKALRTMSHLPPKADFERAFPQALRFDKDIVLAFCARPDFCSKLYYDRLLHVPYCLTNDKEVMLAYCRKIPRALQQASDEICHDREVVLAAVQRCGLELQYASLELRQDKDIVVAACQTDGRALEFCPPGCPTQLELTTDRDFMLTVLRKEGGPMLRLVKKNSPLRRDREVLLEAVKHGMRLRHVPLNFQQDQEFLLEAVDKAAVLYLEFPKTVQRNRALATKAICSESSTHAVILRALEQCADTPGLRSLKRERAIVHAIVQRADLEYVSTFLEEETDDIFKDDKTIMLSALQRDVKNFGKVSERLQGDPDVVMAAVGPDTASDVLTKIGSAMQEEHPEITVKAITVCNSRCSRLMRPLIANGLWQNRDVAIAYLRRFARVLETFESLLATDEEMALEVAQYAQHDFGRVGESLRSNLAFMTRAVDVNGRVLRYATREVRTNLDLCVRAVASHPDALGTTAAEGTTLFGMDRNAVKAHVQSKLDLHQNFVRDFLRGIAIPTPHLPPAQRSQLPMLDRGVETSEAFKHLIAQFVGVPVGVDLRIMRTAKANLERPPSMEGRMRRTAAAMMEIEEDMMMAMPGGGPFGRHAERLARRRMLRRRMDDMLPVDVPVAMDAPNRAGAAGGAGGAGGGVPLVVRLGGAADNVNPPIRRGAAGVPGAAPQQGPAAPEQPGFFARMWNGIGGVGGGGNAAAPRQDAAAAAAARPPVRGRDAVDVLAELDREDAQLREMQERLARHAAVARPVPPPAAVPPVRRRRDVADVLVEIDRQDNRLREMQERLDRHMRQMDIDMAGLRDVNRDINRERNRDAERARMIVDDVDRATRRVVDIQARMHDRFAEDARAGVNAARARARPAEAPVARRLGAHPVREARFAREQQPPPAEAVRAAGEAALGGFRRANARRRHRGVLFDMDDDDDDDDEDDMITMMMDMEDQMDRDLRRPL